MMLLCAVLAAAMESPACEAIAYWKCYPDTTALRTALEQKNGPGGKPTAHLSILSKESSERATFFQSVKAEKYSGRPVRLAAYMKTGDFKGQVALAAISFDGTPHVYLYSRAFKANQATPWQRVEVTFTVPHEAVLISFGLLFKGATGEVWLSQVEFDPIDACGPECKSGVKSPRLTHSELVRQQDELKSCEAAPQNLNFEAH